MSERPFEIVAACELPSLPTSQDIAALAARLDRARGGVPSVVSATPQPPAIYRNQGYVLEARFVAWASSPEDATELVRRLLDGATVSCRSAHPSGRALVATDVPRPEGPAPQPRGRTSRGGTGPGPLGKRGSRVARARVQSRVKSRGGRSRAGGKGRRRAG